MFHAALSDSNWSEIYEIANEENNPNKAYELFIKIFTHLYNIFFPLKKIKIASKNYCTHPWMTEGLKRSCSVKSKLYKKFIKNRSE